MIYRHHQNDFDDGLAESDFKTRYRNHTASFRHAKHRNSTELSKHIWTLKDNVIEHFISWHIPSSHSQYNSSNKAFNASKFQETPCGKQTNALQPFKKFKASVDA